MQTVTKPGHFNQEVAGTTQLWSGTDSEKRFQENLADPYFNIQLKQLGWIDPGAITYRYNSEGFRCKEFDSRPAGIALGCSHTQGVGVDEDSTWPVQLSQLMGEEIWNLGIQGAALDTCFRILEYWIQQLNVKFVVCFVPGLGRYEVFRQGWVNVLPRKKDCPEWLTAYQKNWVMFEENSNLNQRKNLLAMQQICDQYNVPFYYDTNESSPGSDHKHGRDLLHYGRQGHKKLAEKMHDLIKGKI